MTMMNIDTSSVIALVFLICCCNSIETRTSLEKSDHQFGPFDGGYYSTFAVLTNATISNKALQITPDSAGNFTLQNRSGRVFFNQSFALWSDGPRQIASFNTSFLINVFRVKGSATPGEGMAFVIAPSLDVPEKSSGQWLGLTNAATDGNATNRLVAVELDTFKQDYDPDANHLGLDVNSVKSLKTVSLKSVGIEIAPKETRFHMVWIQYDGPARKLSVYMAEQPGPGSVEADFEILSRPDDPVMTAEDLDLSLVLARKSYFGFAGSTGSSVQLNCVLRWNLTVDLLPGESIGDTISGGSGSVGIKIAAGVAAAVGAAAAAGVGYYVWRRRRATADPAILGVLKSLPGMPREFKFGELKKATNKFDEKHNKLGQGGFGVVYRGLLAKEDLEIAVKRFSRDNIQGKDDFLSELTIINRLRHKHLVRLLGWCHEKDTLLLVYEYMPNGSLDAHLFCGSEKVVLSWLHRHKIVADVASGLQYLHDEYDQKVIHRDLKASNIMLDASFNARLGDFGLARAIENERTSYADLEAKGVPGTMGYIAPECFHTGRATRESDVYSFGAVVLEVVCGHRPSTKKENFQLLLDWVWWLHREGCLLKAVDERLGAEFDPKQAKRLLLLGLACSHPIAADRPKTQAIVQIISGSVEAPYVPLFKPAFVWPSEMPGGFDLDSSESNNYSMATSLTSGSSWPVGVSEP